MMFHGVYIGVKYVMVKSIVKYLKRMNVNQMNIDIIMVNVFLKLIC